LLYLHLQLLPLRHPWLLLYPRNSLLTRQLLLLLVSLFL
jgi:hypothetical protein